MALFQLDSEQFDRLNASIEQLSDNIAKWQAEQTVAIQSGFSALIAALTGADVEEVQQRINQHTSQISAVKETLQSSIDRNQPKGE